MHCPSEIDRDTAKGVRFAEHISLHEIYQEDELPELTLGKVPTCSCYDCNEQRAILY
jgi:hypothetical protein